MERKVAPEKLFQGSKFKGIDLNNKDGPVSPLIPYSFIHFWPGEAKSDTHDRCRAIDPM